MNQNERNKRRELKNEIKMSVYNYIIETIMSSVSDYEDLSPGLKLQLTIVVKQSSYINQLAS